MCVNVQRVHKVDMYTMSMSAQCTSKMTCVHGDVLVAYTMV